MIFLKKNKNFSGFSLVELMVAMVVMTAIVPILDLQSRLLRGVFASHSIIESLGLVNNLFVRADISKLYKKTEPTVKKVEDPEMVLTYTAKKSEDKKLLSGANNIVIERLKVENNNIFSNAEDTFISLHFVPESSESELEGKSQ